MTAPSLLAVHAGLKRAAERRRANELLYFRPYRKQALFLALGAVMDERLLIAGNQLGKTHCGGAEVSYHLTGLYPPDWIGQRYDRPIRAWAAGESSLAVRDIQQAKLCGPPGVENSLGTGLIPKDCFADKPTTSRGVSDAFDTIQVRHHAADGKVDGISTMTFKSYEQGRPKFQGEPVDLIWCDEEPPPDIYSECLTRTTATKGKVLVTFSPLNGPTELVGRFKDQVSPSRGFVTMTIHDAEHIRAEDIPGIIARVPPHERDARIYGIPSMGSGRVFPYTVEQVDEDGIAAGSVPAHWGKLWATDFGIGHPFAAVLLLWDKDNDVIHVQHALRMPDTLPIMHAAAMKTIGAGVPVAWPHDGNQRDKGSGETLASIYKKQGLVMLSTHATFPDGGYSTEAGILDICQRIETGRFKVAKHLAAWFEEFRGYHRKDGLIVKVRDDLMSATRIGVMAIRHARQVPLGSHGRDFSREPKIADGVDFNVFDPNHRDWDVFA
jgi:phage terminase large subunit-like protein